MIRIKVLLPVLVIVVVAQIAGQFSDNSLQIRNCPIFCNGIGVCDGEGVCHVRTENGRFPSQSQRFGFQRNLNSFDFIPENEPLQDSVFRVTIEDERPPPLSNPNYSYNYRGSAGTGQRAGIPLVATSRVISSRYFGPGQVANDFGITNALPAVQAFQQIQQQQLAQAPRFEVQEIPAVPNALLESEPIGQVDQGRSIIGVQGPADSCNRRGFRCRKFETPPVSAHCVAFGVRNCLVCNWRGQCVKSSDDAWDKFCTECKALKNGSCDKERRQCITRR